MDIHNPVGDGVLDIPCERTARYFADNRNNGKNYEGTPQLTKGMIKMAKMNVRKLKKRCDVRGCKSLDTFCISRSCEFGGSVIICESCLREALAAIENYVEPKKKTDTKPPELFYSSQVIDKPQDVENETLSTEQDEKIGAEQKENATSEETYSPVISDSEVQEVRDEPSQSGEEKKAVPKRTRAAAKKKTAERGNDK